MAVPTGKPGKQDGKDDGAVFHLPLQNDPANKGKYHFKYIQNITKSE